MNSSLNHHSIIAITYQMPYVGVWVLNQRNTNVRRVLDYFSKEITRCQLRLHSLDLNTLQKVQILQGKRYPMVNNFDDKCCDADGAETTFRLYVFTFFCIYPVNC